MANLAKQVSTDAGVALNFVAASVGGDVAPFDSTCVLLVNNGGASPCTVTLTTPETVGGLAVADRTVNVAAGAIASIGPFGAAYDDAVSGGVDVAYSEVTSVTVAVLSVPQ